MGQLDASSCMVDGECWISDTGCSFLVMISSASNEVHWPRWVWSGGKCVMRKGEWGAMNGLQATLSLITGSLEGRDDLFACNFTGSSCDALNIRSGKCQSLHSHNSHLSTYESQAATCKLSTLLSPPSASLTVKFDHKVPLLLLLLLLLLPLTHPHPEALLCSEFASFASWVTLTRNSWHFWPAPESR